MSHHLGVVPVEPAQPLRVVDGHDVVGPDAVGEVLDQAVVELDPLP